MVQADRIRYRRITWQLSRQRNGKKGMSIIHIFFAHFCCEQEVLTNQLKNKNYEFVAGMIVRYDKIKSIALAQGNDFNFNTYQFDRTPNKVHKKRLLSQSRAKLRHGFSYILFWSNCHP